MTNLAWLPKCGHFEYSGRNGIKVCFIFFVVVHMGAQRPPNELEQLDICIFQFAQPNRVH